MSRVKGFIYTIQSLIKIINNAQFSNNKGYAIELSTGIQMSPHFRLGIGSSYLEQDYNIGAAFVPVYIDLKLMGSGKFKPYVFFQPGFCIYKSNIYYILDYNGDEI